MSRIDPELDAALTQAMRFAERGERDLAAQRIRQIRETFNVSETTELMVRVMLAEGVMHANDGDALLARDRVWRALELSRARGLRSLAADGHAWMAFLEYDDYNVEEFARHAVSAVRLGDNASDYAIARAASVLGTAYQLCDAKHDAMSWFAKAREAAIRAGDSAITSAIIFNMAATRFSVSRVAHICDDDHTAVESTDLLFLTSAVNYDHMSRLSVRGYFHCMLKGFADSIRSDFVNAIGSLEEYLRDPTRKDGRADSLVLAERAWCLLKCGRPEEAASSANDALKMLHPRTDLDDLSILYRRLSDFYGETGRVDLQRKYRERSSQSLAAFRAHQIKVRLILDSV